MEQSFCFDSTTSETPFCLDVLQHPTALQNNITKWAHKQLCETQKDKPEETKNP